VHPSLTGNLESLIRERLSNTDPPGPERICMPGVPGDLPLLLRRIRLGRVVPAAVLVPLMDRPEGLSVLLTRRADHLTHHGGQISFPGGRLEPSDKSAAEAALRETEEEIGMPPDNVEVIGYLDNYITITGYSVTPVVGIVRPDFEMRIDETEVAEAFEVPLAYVLDPARVRRREKKLFGIKVAYYEIPYEQHNIWGATAGMLVALGRILTGEQAGD